MGELNPCLRHLRSIYRAARRIRHHARSADVSAADIIQEGTVAQGWAAVLFGRHAMMDLYFVTSPNVTKVVIALEEMGRSEEHTSELQSLMRISYAVFCLKKQTVQAHTTLHLTLRS